MEKLDVSKVVYIQQHAPSQTFELLDKDRKRLVSFNILKISDERVYASEWKVEVDARAQVNENEKKIS